MKIRSLKQATALIIAIACTFCILYEKQVSASTELDTYKNLYVTTSEYELNILKNFCGLQKWDKSGSSGNSGDATGLVQATTQADKPLGKYSQNTANNMLNVLNTRVSTLKASISTINSVIDESERGNQLASFIKSLTPQELVSVSTIHFNYYYDSIKQCMIQTMTGYCSTYTFTVLIIWKNGGVIYYEEKR